MYMNVATVIDNIFPPFYTQLSSRACHHIIKVVNNCRNPWAKAFMENFLACKRNQFLSQKCKKIEQFATKLIKFLIHGMKNCNLA